MSRIIVRTIALLAIGLLATACACAQDMAELEVDHALTFEFETPHTDWAQPYAGETTRVLVFCNGRGTVPRHIVEMMQRFDVEAEAVFWIRVIDRTDQQWLGGETGVSRMLQLLEQDWDAYIFLELNLSDMSSEQQYKVLKPVTEGAGIVFVGSNDERVLKPDNRITDFDAGRVAPAGEGFAVGQGRGVRMDACPELGYYEGWDVDYDYWAEGFGRSVLWAAGREPQMTLGIDTGDQTFAWDAEKTFTLNPMGAARGANPKVRMRVRRPGGPTVDLPERDLPARAFSVRVDALPSGPYHFDAWVVSDAGVETWASAPFTVTTDLRVAMVRLDRDWGEVGDTISGSVSVEGAPTADDRLRVGLFDRRGRLLKQEIVSASGASDFSFEIEPWMPMLVRVDAGIFRNPAGEPARTIDSAYEYFHVTTRHFDRFNFLMWDVPRGPLAPWAEKSLVDASVTLQLGQGQPPTMLAAYDVAWVPYTTRIMTPKTEDGIMRPFCWNDEEAVTAHVREKAEEYRPSRQHGVYVWSLGDEVTTTGSCLSPHCARAYREYLAEVYGSLEALNESWGTNFTDWEQVGISKEGDNDEANSLAEGNYPRWFDRKAFQSYNFVQFCQAYDEAYSAVDPFARTGFEGAGRFDRGDDLDLIIRENEFWSPYPGVADEVIRSVAPPDFPRSNWMGYTKDADSLLGRYWRMITRDMTSVWWWRWDALGRFHGWLAPDLRPFPAVQEILRDTQIVRDGLGDLLMPLEIDHTGIAVLYSFPAQFACTVEDGTTYGSYESSHVGFHEMVRDLGYQFRYVTDRMLRLGEFDADDYRMMILPRIEALGVEEAAVIRDFVENGGVVIADVRPAIYDGHCKPLADGLLDDVFGIDADGRAPARVSAATIGELTIENAKVDPTISLTTARAAGDADGVPVWITNRFGEGAAILLNMDSGSFPKLGTAGAPESAAALAYELISRSNVHRQPVSLTGADGGRLRNIEVVRWPDGAGEIMALFRTSGSREMATIELPEPRQVYNLRTREELGRVRSFGVEIIPNRATFLALLPGPVPAARLTQPQFPVNRGAAPQLALSVPGADSLYAFRIRVTHGGMHLDWHDDVVVAGPEEQIIDIPIAFNDPLGDYTVEAIELFTGRPTTATVRVN